MGMIRPDDTDTEMKNMTDPKPHRAFFILDPAHFSRGVVAEVMFGIYPDDTSAKEIEMSEMAMRWIELGDGTTACRIEVFDESWTALSRMTDLLEAIAQVRVSWANGRRPRSAPMTVEGFCELLASLGFADRTRKHA